MKATRLSRLQHNEIVYLFERFERATSLETRNEAFEKLAHLLVAHAVVEREVLLPACREVLGPEAMLAAAAIEDDAVELAIHRADLAMSTEDLPRRVAALKAAVERHVEREETGLLIAAERALGDRLDELGDRMEARFDEVMRHDFRTLLRANLETVLGRAFATDVRVVNRAKALPRRTSVARDVPSHARAR